MQSRSIAREQGFAMYFVIMTMAVILTLGSALAVSGSASISGVNRDELSVRAFQAAEAGAQTALHRLNLQQPDASHCIVTQISTPATATSWCASSSSESIGHDQSFSYRVSTPSPSACTGAVFGTGIVERCIVSIGSAGGLTRRVVQRVASLSGLNPFPIHGVVGRDSVTIGNNTDLSAGVGTNGMLTVGNNSTITGGVQLWSSAPLPSGYSGAVVRSANPYVLSPPNMINPATLTDSASSNDNGRLSAGGADSCSGGSGPSSSCYTNTTGSPRTLSIGNNGSVTLGGATYNFCQLNLGNNAAVNIASNARALIYIDSPQRAGSGCTATQGGISSGNNALFSNPTGDPSALQLIIYGSTAYPVISFPNNINLAAAIYSPGAGVSFKNNGSFTGGIAAKSVVLKNNAAWDSRLDNFSLATTLIYFRGAWRQCPMAGGTATNPAAGCL